MRPNGDVSWYTLSDPDILQPCLALPGRAEQTALVILLHGIGDSAPGMQGFAEQLRARLPWAEFVLPSAPCGSWYTRDVAGQLQGNETVRHALLQLVDKQCHNRRVPVSRAAFVGFSQGAAMALWTALQLQSTPCGGLVLLAGGAEELYVSDVGRQTPVLYCAGGRDYTVPLAATRCCRDRLRNLGLNVDYLEFPHMGHGLSEEVVDCVADFLHPRLVGNTFVGQVSAASRRASVTALSSNCDAIGTLGDPTQCEEVRISVGTIVTVHATTDVPACTGVIKGFNCLEQLYVVDLAGVYGQLQIAHSAFTQRIRVTLLQTKFGLCAARPDAVQPDPNRTFGVVVGVTLSTKDGGVDAYLVDRCAAEADEDPDLVGGRHNDNQHAQVAPHRVQLPFGSVLRLEGLGTTDRGRRYTGRLCRILSFLEAEGRYLVNVGDATMRAKPRQLVP